MKIFDTTEMYQIVIYSVLLGLSFIVLVAHITALIIMLRYYKAIKFENLVIFGGTIECIILIISNIINLNFLIEISDSIQIMIIIYIIRRLTRTVQNKYFSTPLPLYQYLFVFLTFLNYAILSAFIISLILTHNSLLTKSLCVSFAAYSDLVCLFFLIVGLKIKQFIIQEVKDSHEGNVKIFDDTRLLQIQLLIFSFLPCSFYQTVFVILREFFFEEDFEKTEFSYKPITKRGFYLNMCCLASILILTFVTYIAFYWLIKNVFKKNKNPSKPEEGINISENGNFNILKPTKEMEQFLNEDDANKVMPLFKGPIDEFSETNNY